ncbi:hypothetical protein MKY30_06750 [Oceanobacillus sp. FSL W8-0428]|uniref:Uncharacterized protein n=1 Tax=Oceanobacillus sojae TaxID=582851 RepID=A0A511ZMF5_9BACI|nr:hypothetical protein [Oceanobacillus sojae]GEN88638.1 hypothetical protein OSO01_33770 [Oceanobacillus sojae]
MLAPWLLALVARKKKNTLICEEEGTGQFIVRYKWKRIGTWFTLIPATRIK